jgi:oligo-1,6-glucosidase
MLVLLNFTDHDSSIRLAVAKNIREILIDNYDEVANENGKVTLKPYQAIIFELESLVAK